MSLQTVAICDIDECQAFALHTYPMYIHGEQKGEDSFAAYVYKGDVDLCGSHEHQYRTNLPKLKLKEDLAKSEDTV